jgi:hypothetical protein
MLVGRMNPLTVRVHVGVEEKRIKTPYKISGLPHEISEIAASSRIEEWLPTLDTFRTFATQLAL